MSRAAKTARRNASGGADMLPDEEALVEAAIGSGSVAKAPTKTSRKQAAASQTLIDSERRVALDVLNSMAEGAILWGADGTCVLCNPRAAQILELDPEDLAPGMPRDDFLEASVLMGAITREQCETRKAGFAAGKPFTFERTTATGREIKAHARPCKGGGFVVTLSDVSDLRVQELIVAKAKEKAEKAQAELSERLADVTMEKTELEAQRAELERTALVATHASDLVYITNPQGRIEWINRAFAQRTGYDLKAVAGKRPLEMLTGPESCPEEIDKLSDGFKARRMTRAELLLYAADQSSFWFKCELIPIFSPDGRNTHFISVGRDVTERRLAWREAEQGRLFEQRKREESHLLTEFNEWLQSCDTQAEMFEVVRTFLARLLPNCKGSIYIFNETRDVLDGICAWNGGPILTQIEPGECWGLRRGRPHVYGENQVAFACSHVERQYEGAVPERYCCIPISAHGDTVGMLHVEIPVLEVDGRPLTENELAETQKLVSICAEQISLAIANLKLRDQLREQSIRDVLTGLYNRRYFLEYANRELNRAASAGTPVSLIMFDVDKFKLFNDTHGHDAGDAVLRAISGVMTDLFTGAEVACRFGGEEFIALLPGTYGQALAQRAETLRLAVEMARVRYGNQNLNVTISAGTCTFPDQGDLLDNLIRRADLALYMAKERGRNQVVMADEIDPDQVMPDEMVSNDSRVQSRIAGR